MKILIQIKDNKIYFKVKKNISQDLEKLLNTNIISDNELTFSDEYIKQNQKIVHSFLNELIKEHNIDTCYIYNDSISILIIDLIKNITNIHHLILKDNIKITFKVCDKISKIKHLKTLSCLNMPDFMIEILDKKGIVVEMRDEIFFTSKFMISNNLKLYSSMFYKKSINLEFPFKDDDYIDFESFLNINKYLKIIHVNKTIKRDFEEIINKLNEYKKVKLKIIIHENINDLELIEYIKKINTKSKKTSKNKISISYSDKYLKKNFMPQANISILKLCLFIIFIIIVGSFGYAFTNNYISYRKDVSIKADIQEVITQQVDTDDLMLVVEKLEKESEKEVKNDYIASLLTLNTDTTGWIKVNNTTIDYPIVQGNDNKYYLDRNIKHEYDFNGWIYMDFRNDPDMTDDNTIIYGHTNYNAAVMFGSLKNTLYEDWQNNEENRIISIDTVYESLKYEVFSTYTINNTNDYLNINYSSPFDKLEFFTMLKERSNYNYNVDLTTDDKIITLSTCDDGGIKRLVLHAVLINE